MYHISLLCRKSFFSMQEVHYSLSSYSYITYPITIFLLWYTILHTYSIPFWCDFPLNITPKYKIGNSVLFMSHGTHFPLNKSIYTSTIDNMSLYSPNLLILYSHIHFSQFNLLPLTFTHKSTSKLLFLIVDNSNQVITFSYSSCVYQLTSLHFINW